MSIRKHVFGVIYLCIAMLVFIGCLSPSVGAPTPMLSPLATPEASATPHTTDPTLVVVSPLPIATDAPTRVPLRPGMGAVSGELERFDGTTLKSIIVYAALIEQRGEMGLASVDPLLDARSVTDAQGSFWFDNLAPGEYALATQSPIGIIMPHNTEGEIVRFRIEADGELALGRLAVGYPYPDNN
jgi:hypothetical protein